MTKFFYRTLGESFSLASLLLILFRSLVMRENIFLTDNRQSLDGLTTRIRTQWEYAFALQICDHYSCIIWLPSLVMALQKIETGTWRKELFLELLVAVQFTSDKLEDPEISFKLKFVDNADDIQVIPSYYFWLLCIFIVSAHVWNALNMNQADEELLQYTLLIVPCSCCID